MRFPEKLYEDLRTYALDNSTTMTDVVIASLNGVLYGVADGCTYKSECGVATDEKPVRTDGIKPIGEVLETLKDKIDRKPFFNPMPKGRQMYNRGKGK